MNDVLGIFGSVVLIVGIVVSGAGIYRLWGGMVRHASRSRRDQDATASAPPVTAAPPRQSGPGAPADAKPVAQGAGGRRDEESLIARTLLTAQKSAEDVVRTARAEAETIVARAETAAGDIVETGRRDASEIVRKARQDADEIVGAARHRTAAWLARLRAEADRLVGETHHTFQQAQRSVEQDVAAVASRLELSVVDLEAAFLDGADGDPLTFTAGGEATPPARVRDISGSSLVAPGEFESPFRP